MRSLRLSLAAVLAGLVAVPGLMAQDMKPDQVQQVRRFSRELTRTVTLDYLLFLPKDHAAQPQKKWPLILFLHGAGERGTNIWSVAVHGPPKIVREKPDFPFIVVSPQCPAGQRWADDAVLALLDDVLERYPVDRKRVYLTGLSMGGYGTWSLGMSHPGRFAAIVPICGGGDPLKTLLPDPQNVQALRTLPVWAFHGAKDTVVKLAESERMVDALRKFGGKEVELTVYPDAQHDSWTETYANPRLYDWLLKHSREDAR